MTKEQMNELLIYSEIIFDVMNKIDKVYNNALEEHNKKPKEWEKDTKTLDHIRMAISYLVYARAYILSAEFWNEE